MTTPEPPFDLNAISVATPCSADWNKMVGDDKVRFCAQCKLSVYNLSALTEPQANRLIEQREGRLCVRYFRRADGTVLTQDCPEGLMAMARRARMRARALVASVTLAWAAWLGQSDWAVRTLGKWPPTRKLLVRMGVTEEPGRFVVPPAWKTRAAQAGPHINGLSMVMPTTESSPVAPMKGCAKPTPEAIMGDYAEPAPPSARPDSGLIEMKGEMVAPAPKTVVPKSH